MGTNDRTGSLADWGNNGKRLTARIFAALDRPGRYYDGDVGLFLAVQARKGRIRKSYVQRLTVHGRRVDIGLGG